MAIKKHKKIAPKTLMPVVDILEELLLALGTSVIMLEQTQKAVKKDAVTLRVNAEQFRDSVRQLHRMEKVLRAELRKAGVQ